MTVGFGLLQWWYGRELAVGYAIAMLLMPWQVYIGLQRGGLTRWFPLMAFIHVALGVAGFIALVVIHAQLSR
jgi:hypothetical protein